MWWNDKLSTRRRPNSHKSLFEMELFWALSVYSQTTLVLVVHGLTPVHYKTTWVFPQTVFMLGPNQPWDQSMVQPSVQSGFEAKLFETMINLAKRSNALAISILKQWAMFYQFHVQYPVAIISLATMKLKAIQYVGRKKSQVEKH